MRSTRQFLNEPFKAGTQHNCKRVEAIYALREKAQLPALLIPEEYLDAFTERIMQHPVDFSITDHDLIIVDLDTVKFARKANNGHPLNRQPLKPLVVDGHKVSEPYLLDECLAKRIDAFITIEELKLYIATCEAQRGLTLLKALDGKSDEDAERILALLGVVRADEMMQLDNVPMRMIPKHFFGDVPHSGVMTLPVILDGIHRIDFFDLIKVIPDNHQLTAEQLKKRAEKTITYKAERTTSFIREKDAQIARICATGIGEQFSKADRKRQIDVIHMMHENRVNSLQQLTEEEIFPAEAREYSNPYTGKPIESIMIDYKLLAEIDCFLDSLERQMLAVEKEFRYHEASLKNHFSALLHGKSFSQILSDEKYPLEKIPESLSLGQIPGAKHLEIMTHPVLLDGVDLIDFCRLQEFWRPKPGYFFSTPGCRGMNPFTKQPIKSIVYDKDLESDTDHFVLNRETFKMFTTVESAQNANYLRGSQFRSFKSRIIRMRELAITSNPEDRMISQPSKVNKRN